MLNDDSYALSEKKPKPCNYKAFFVKLLLIKGEQAWMVLRVEALYAALASRCAFWLSSVPWAFVVPSLFAHIGAQEREQLPLACWASAAERPCWRNWPNRMWR